MNENEIKELDRILSEEEELNPKAEFSTLVMRAVREEAAERAPIPFPWARFLPGFCLNLGMLLAGLVWVFLMPGSPAETPLITAEMLSDPRTRDLTWAVATMVATGALGWATARWVSPGRASSV
ncbi:MAG: hypothetical protein AAF604_10680 [Acidobacteriota bacterium]